MSAQTDVKLGEQRGNGGGPVCARGLPWWAWTGGLIAIIVALAAAGALSWQHLTGNTLPGCGGVRQASSGTSLADKPNDEAKPACATLEAHPMGSLGGMNFAARALLNKQTVGKVPAEKAWWPMSYVGTAYFAAALAGWLLVGLRGRWIGRLPAWVLRMGAMGSLVYLAVIIIDGKFCQYCIASHAGNLALLGFLEIGMLISGKTGRVAQGRCMFSGVGAVLAGLAAFALTSVTLGSLESARKGAALAKSEAEFSDSMSEINAKIAADQAAAVAAQTKPVENPWPNGLRARWNLGPDSAPVRVVILSSYQCPDCKRIEDEAFQMLEKYKGKMSLGAMHFPLNPDCNKYVTKGNNPHPNACWAARAAEAAGLLKGADGFWAMHKWLFEVKGTFTQEEIRAELPKLGHDPNVFFPIMTGEATLRPLEADIDVGEKLGLYFTPMIFINGVELRGWNVPGALVRAVDGLMALNPQPPALNASVDKPPLASRKYVEDWKFAPRANISVARDGRSQGPAAAKVQVIVYGDYTEPNTQKVHDIVLGWATSADKSVRYNFRQFPGDQTCNKGLHKTFFANGCLTARAAEAAGAVAGPAGFWKMHNWIFAFENKDKITLEDIKKGAATLGIDAAKLEAAMNSPSVDQAIQMDIGSAQQVGVTQIPAVYVNGRLVQRWTRENDDVMGRILVEAMAELEAPKPK